MNAPSGFLGRVFALLRSAGRIAGGNARGRRGSWSTRRRRAEIRPAPPGEPHWQSRQSDRFRRSSGGCAEDRILRLEQNPFGPSRFWAADGVGVEPGDLDETVLARVPGSEPPFDPWLSRLPEEHATPLRLHFLEGLSSKEVAERLRLPGAHAARMRIRRAGRAVRKLFERRERARGLIGVLPEEHANPLRLAVLDRLPLDEVARRLLLPDADAARACVHRARTALRGLLEERERARKLIGGLPEVLASPLRMAVLDRLTPREVAVRLGLPDAVAARRRVQRAITAVRKLLVANTQG